MGKPMILKAAAVLSYLSFYLLVSITQLNPQQARFIWLWYGIPSLLILLIPKRWSALARGMAIGQGMWFCLQAMLPLALALPSNGLSNGTVSLLGFVLAQALLVFAALLLGWPLKTAEIVPLVCGATASLLFITLTVRRWEGTQSIPSAGNLYRTVGCLDQYALAHGGLYPASLEELTRTTGQYCVIGSLSSGPWRPQRLVYQSSQASDGRIVGYSILFGPDNFWGNVRTAWYVDQTGLIHTSPEGQIANKQSPVWSNEMLELKSWNACYAKYADADPANGASFDWKSVLHPEGPCEPDIRNIQDGHVQLGQSYTAHFHAKPPDSSGRQVGFYVVARPDQYGSSGIRSYYLDETGIIRGTPHNREPNSTDEPAPECEWIEHLTCRNN
jgi:hypothetical protein